MKTLKRISALLLVLMLMASFSITAFADIVINTGGGGEGGSSTTIGILEGESQISYTDSNGGQHSLDVPGGNKPTIIDEAGGHDTPGAPDLPDIGKDDIKDFVQQQINNNDPVNQRPGINNENSSSGNGSGTGGDSGTGGAVENGYNTGDVAGSGNSSGTSAAATDAKAEGSANPATDQPVAASTGDHLTTGPLTINDDTSTVAVGVIADGPTGEDASASVKVNGDVTLEGNNGEYATHAVSADAFTGDATVEVSGSVSLTQNASASAAAVWCSGSDGTTAAVTVEGDVSAVRNGTGLPVNGISVVASSWHTDTGGVSVVDIGGSVYGENTGINAFTVGPGSVTVNAANVTGGGTGIIVSNTNNENSSITITVGTFDKDGNLKDGTGIVSGGIDLSRAANADNVSVTVWKTDSVTGSACDAAINYIVKIAEDSKKAISAGGEVETNNNITTANLGATITVQPKAGYKVTGVTNNGKDLQRLDNGVFSFILEKNDNEDYYGGILLSAIFEKLPQPQPTPVGPVAAVTYKLKFDLGGGVMPDGKTELELKCSAGQKITLPEAPTREGFTFVGWETTIRGKTVILDAGAKFTVTAAKTFVALWEEN